MLRSAKPATLVLLAAIALVALAGCSTPSTPSAGTAEQPAGQSSVNTTVTPMSIADKQSMLAPNFQVEVPVPNGTVVRADAQGDEAWDYEIIVAAPPAAVANWYQDAYLGRDWKLVGQESPAQGALTLTLVKNAAQTRVTITPEGDGSSRVKGVLGVGAPVLQQQ